MSLPDDPRAERRVRQVEILISSLLRIGVITSLCVVVAGLVLSFTHHRDYLRSVDQLKLITAPTRYVPHTFEQIALGLREMRGESVILLGLLLLIATPVMRVAVSIFAFLFQRDWIFVAVTAFVLAMLILSFVLGKVE